MKKIFLLTAMAVMVLASCNRNEEEMGNVSGKKATLVISIKSPEMRAESAVADFDSDTKPADAIDNFTAFILDQSGRVMALAHSETDDDLEMDVTTQAKTVYVVANAGDFTSTFSTSSTLADLEAKIIDLNGATTADGGQTLNNRRWATGSKPISFVKQDDDTFEATPEVTLTFVAARIRVKIAVDELMKDNYDPAATADDGSLVLTKVAVLNARGQSLLFGTPTASPLPPTSLIPTYAANKKYYEGLDNPAAPDNFVNYPATTAYTYSATTATLLSDNLAGDYNTTNKAFDKMYYYYVFENDAIAPENQPTIVIIEGEYGQDDERKSIYFPVHLAPYEQFTSGSGSVNGIIRGNSYDITITLTGDPSFDDGGDYPGDTGGTKDPTNPVVNAKVTVSVELNKWNPVKLGKTF